jgi:aminopeptidase N
MNKAFIFLFIILLSCQNESKKDAVSFTQHPNDHVDYTSVAHKSKARIKHLSLTIQVDFDSLILKGVAGYNIERNKEEKIHFDIQNLEITRVLINDSNNYRKITDASFIIHHGDENGDDLEVSIDDYTSTVYIVYKTKPVSKALQWLPKEQTRSKKAGFLYTNGFSNHTRSWIPIQDSPGIRITYEAIIKTPRNVMALMSAENEKINNDKGEYLFFQANPIPPYLIALAVGDIQYNHIIDNLGVFAEPSFLIRASDELENVDKMMAVADSLYGMYQWDRLDFLLMPGAFPLGGMENPQLPFISPTIIAGDKSLTNTIVHEIAHAWTSSIVSNATWNDFWLNEGFTVYLENRILEELHGLEFVEMQEELSYLELLEEIKLLPAEDTRLKIDLGSREPDDAFTLIPYQKGYFFLKALENEVGREQMDAFLNNYFKHFAFQSITTEDFLIYMDKELFADRDPVIDIEAWVYEPGLPQGFEVKSSKRSVEINKEIDKWIKGEGMNEKITASWGTFEKVYFIQQLPTALSTEQINELDSAFSFSKSNIEIQYVFFRKVIRSNYTDLDPVIESLLLRTGRNKYVRGIYQEYVDNPNGGREKALNVYKKARANYHPFTQANIDVIVDYADLSDPDSELP